MFKSIRWKITSLFILLVTVSELLIGTIMIVTIINSFHKSFAASMHNVFNSDFNTSLTDAANYVSAPTPDPANNMIILEANTTNNIERMKSLINDKSTSLALNSSRFYAILDGSTGETLYTSNSNEDISNTPSVLKALNGETAIENGINSKYMDYAFPIGNDAYIIYIKDTLAQQDDILHTLYMLIACIALISIVISAIAGYAMSKSITIPIQQLTVKAKRLADGDINALELSESNDELGRLTNSLVHLAHSRKESNDKAIGEQIKVETILQNMNDGILAFNMHGNLIHINPEAQRLLHRKYIDDIQFDRFFKEIQANIKLGDLVYMNPDGSVEREVKLANQFLRFNFATFNVDNKIGGIIVIIHDVTRQEKLEQSRRDFVADVSHELRTPLTTIKSYSETLSDMPDVDRELQIRFLDVIASEADRMARIISDLLTLSELDDNKTYFKMPEKIDIRKMVETLVERMGMTAKKKNQTLTYHPINDVPIINGDRDGLERVVINIISNALKYTQTGGHIEVYTSKVYKDICIKVVDNGIGIPKDKIPNLFDRFYRVDKARSRDTGGTGLGLAIAKQTLESAFNGKIKISSELNKGTEVTITIPVSE